MNLFDEAKLRKEISDKHGYYATVSANRKSATHLIKYLSEYNNYRTQMKEHLHFMSDESRNGRLDLK